jgi:hypothetical protein
MTDMSTETSWLLDGIDNLVRLKQELWLTDAEITVIDHGIAAINRFLAEFTATDRNTPHNTARGANGT